jgi:hypothetical protein
LHVRLLAAQFSHVSPLLPQAAFAVPTRHVPVASQHPPQLDEPHAGGAPLQTPAWQLWLSAPQLMHVPPPDPHASV